MKTLKKGLLFLLLPLFAFSTLHKFYVSVTNVQYSEKDDALQVTTRIFIDDFEKVIEERYGVKTKLATEEESKAADDYIEKYLRAKLAFKINDTNKAYTFLGKKYDNDVMICYLELEKIDFKMVQTIEVQNEILTDIFEEQQNIVHFKIDGKKKSFVLIRENNKGMLNL